MDSYAYNPAGHLSAATAPKAIEDRFAYDLLGRTTSTTEAYADGTPSDADDRITRTTYDGLDQARTLTADLPTGQNDQTTEYVYGVSPATNSDVYSFDLLAETRYPDKATGAASTADSDKDRYAYNALGEATKLTDRNGTTREFARDVTGRTLSDSATALGAGVDGAVKRLETAYDTAGRPYLFTSHSAAAGSSVVNQVQRAFNGLGQVTREYENHDGAVNTSTTPYVGYGYDTTAAAGVLTKGSRPTTLTYPNGRVITSNYAAGLDDATARLSSLTDGATTLESYSYLGLGTVVARAHPQPGVDLTYVAASGTGDAGDKYTGLDRFNRIADQRWKKDTSDLDRFVHTYDRNSNRLTRDVLATGAPTSRDEAYTYDNLDRLTKANRGALASGTITDANATYAQRWDGVGSGNGKGLDPLGNWQNLLTDTNGGAAGGATAQARTHNAQNQLATLAAASMTYDANGSLTLDGSTGKAYTYDAWNAVVRVTSGGVTLASHEYDALRRQAQSGTTTPTDERWFSTNWQVLETRPADGKTTQQVWSQVYVDAMVCRDRDTDANGSLDERVYPLHDANFDVTATVNTAGGVIDRFIYERYGTFTVLDANWANDADNASDVGWGFFFQGARFDFLGGGYDVRGRYYVAALGRPVQADSWRENPMVPAAGDGYPDGMSRYEWERSKPVDHLDPSGLGTLLRDLWHLRQAANGAYGLSGMLQLHQAADDGALQGGANALNGAQDGLVGIGNIPATVVNYVAGDTVVGYIPSRDWSYGMFVEEDCDAHKISKFLGGNGLLTIVTFGTSQIGHARHLTHVTTPARAASIRASAAAGAPNAGLSGTPLYATTRPMGNIADAALTGTGRYGGYVPIPSAMVGGFRPIGAIGPVSAWARFGGGGYILGQPQALSTIADFVIGQFGWFVVQHSSQSRDPQC